MSGNLFADKAAKLIRLLSSDKDGEVLNSARALGRMLREARRDWHWLASVTETAWTVETEPKPRRWQRWHPHEPKSRNWDQWRPHEPELQPWQILASELLQRDDILGMRGTKLDLALRDRERSFLTNMRKSRVEPSEFQKRWMRDINARRGRAAA
jgi:hypothetical protein